METINGTIRLAWLVSFRGGEIVAGRLRFAQDEVLFGSRCFSEDVGMGHTMQCHVDALHAPYVVSYTASKALADVRSFTPALPSFRMTTHMAGPMSILILFNYSAFGA